MKTLTSSIINVVDKSSKVYTNTIECFWGLLKRGLLGIYHKTSRKHLQKYINEFVFRYNTRQLNNCQRFYILLSNMTNRLKYRDLIGSLI